MDYPERQALHAEDEGPRCGAHRDFGTFTIINTDASGLQVQLEAEKEWRGVEVEEGSAILVMGWCAAIRANDRIPACLHRVEVSNSITLSSKTFIF